jgi:hypothetical protein
MATPFVWNPEPSLLEEVTNLAFQQGQSPDAIITQAVITYLKAQQHQPAKTPSRGQALIQLMRGKATANLSTDAVIQLTRQNND